MMKVNDHESWWWRRWSWCTNHVTKQVHKFNIMICTKLLYSPFSSLFLKSQFYDVLTSPYFVVTQNTIFFVILHAFLINLPHHIIFSSSLLFFCITSHKTTKLFTTALLHHHHQFNRQQKTSKNTRTLLPLYHHILSIIIIIPQNTRTKKNSFPLSLSIYSKLQHNATLKSITALRHQLGNGTRSMTLRCCFLLTLQ